MNRNSPARQRAARHEARARNYRLRAELLLEQDGDSDSAGALLYEAAKQCINAVANQQGNNPGPTGAKERFLHGIAAQADVPPNLIQRWESAVELHIHADRGHLDALDFMERWERAQNFIDVMLLIYTQGE